MLLPACAWATPGKDKDEVEGARNAAGGAVGDGWATPEEKTQTLPAGSSVSLVFDSKDKAEAMLGAMNAAQR